MSHVIHVKIWCVYVCSAEGGARCVDVSRVCVHACVCACVCAGLGVDDDFLLMKNVVRCVWT